MKTKSMVAACQVAAAVLMAFAARAAHPQVTPPACQRYLTVFQACGRNYVHMLDDASKYAALGTGREEYVKAFNLEHNAFAAPEGFRQVSGIS